MTRPLLRWKVRAALLAIPGMTLLAATVAPTTAAQAASARVPNAVQVAGNPQYTTQGGATPLTTDRTVPHWHSSFTDPTNGVTYGYNMVGNGNPGTFAGTTNVPTEIIPLNFVFAANGGYAFNGSDVSTAFASSPLWSSNSYQTVQLSPTGPSVTLSNSSGVQLEDATMRSQFNDVGASTFHLNLGAPQMLPVQTINVPSNQGTAAYLGNPNQGFSPVGLISLKWFAARMQSLMGSLRIDPATLPYFLTNNTYLYIGNLNNCCVLGFHGASQVPGNGSGVTNGNGKQGVQTWIYAAWTQPNTWDVATTPGSPDGSDGYYIQDIHAASHETSEWADDPFVNNLVNPWVTPTAPQYGCTGVLETGDPVVGIGFLVGTNAYSKGGNADGFWHPEDEVFLPWFARQSPNTTSETLQGGTTGRYTFMGSLNPYPGFQVPAIGC